MDNTEFSSVDSGHMGLVSKNSKSEERQKL